MPGPVTQLSGAGNISDAFAGPSAVHTQGAQQPHCSNPFQDHYADMAASYSQENVAQHAQAFAAHDGGKVDPHAIATLMKLVDELRAEIADMKRHVASHAAHGPHAHPLQSLTDVVNDAGHELRELANARFDEYMAHKIAQKINKKLQEDILELWS